MNWSNRGICPIGSEDTTVIFYDNYGIVSDGAVHDPSGVITPASIDTTTDTSVSLSVISLNTLVYQWQEKINDEWQNIEGENKSEISVFYPHVTGTAGIHVYRCICVGFSGQAATSPATVTVTNKKASTSARITNTSIIPTGTVKLIAYDRLYSDGIQWQELINDSWQNINGAVYDEYEITYPYGTTPGIHSYRAAVTGLDGTVYSNVLSCNVYYLEPTVTISPDLSYVQPPQSTTLTAEYTNADNGIQWQELINDLWQNIPSATGSELIVSYVYGTSKANHYYRCIASGYGGTAISNTVIVGITYPEPTVSITASYDSSNDTVTLTAAHTDSDYGINWQSFTESEDVFDIDGGWRDILYDQDTLVIDLISEQSQGISLYRCVALGYGGSATSNTIDTSIYLSEPEPAYSEENED